MVATVDDDDGGSGGGGDGGGGNFHSSGEHLIELWFYLRIPRGINSNK